MVGRMWGWGESSHACGPGLHSFEHPAGTKVGSTQACLSSCPDGRKKGKAEGEAGELSAVKQPNWRQPLLKHMKKIYKKNIIN